MNSELFAQFSLNNIFKISNSNKFLQNIMLFALFNLNKVFLLYLLPNQPVRLDRILIYINLLQQDQAWYMSSGCSTRRKSSQSHSWSRSLSPTSPGAHSPPPALLMLVPLHRGQLTENLANPYHRVGPPYTWTLSSLFFYLIFGTTTR